MEKTEIICTVCPMGCKLSVQEDKNASLGYDVQGNSCKLGIKYGISELTNPMRVLTTTVRLQNKRVRRLPVRTSAAIPKKMIFDCMKIINELNIKNSVRTGDILIKGICGTDVNLIASKSI